MTLKQRRLALGMSQKVTAWICCISNMRLPMIEGLRFSDGNEFWSRIDAVLTMLEHGASESEARLAAEALRNGAPGMPALRAPKELPYHRPCLNPGCGAPVPKSPSRSVAEWLRTKYCCEKCRCAAKTGYARSKITDPDQASLSPWAFSDDVAVRPSLGRVIDRPATRIGSVTELGALVGGGGP